MRKLLLLLFALPLAAQGVPKSCLIARIHQHRFGENMARMHTHKQFDYVEGDFPAGIKFMADFGSNQVQEIQSKGGKVIVLRPDYQLPDLQDARQQCSSFMASAVQKPAAP